MLRLDVNPHAAPVRNVCPDASRFWTGCGRGFLQAGEISRVILTSRRSIDKKGFDVCLDEFVSKKILMLCSCFL